MAMRTFFALLLFLGTAARASAAPSSAVRGTVKDASAGSEGVVASRLIEERPVLRCFRPRPLIEDNSVRSRASTTLNARASWRVAKGYTVSVNVFNLTDAKASDIDYYYESRLPGEPADGIADIHTHPLESRSFRASLTATF
jgi:hypothetical protein